MTTSWGGTSIPDPSEITVVEEHVGTQYLTADGAMNTDTIATRLRYTLTFKLITKAQWDTIYGKATTNTSASILLPIYGTITAIPIRGQAQSSPVGGASALVNGSCVVRTTS